MTFAPDRETRGFTLIELMVAALLAALVMGASLSLVDSAQRAFQSQSDAPDLEQRLRASVDSIAGSVRAAGGIDAPIRPYRIGAVRDDAAAGVFFRPDAVSLVSGGESTTYWLRADGSGTFDLMEYDGQSSDLPLVDRVVRLSFDYFGGDGTTISPALLQDGPWLRDAAGRPFDADLNRVRSVAVRLAVRSALGARLVPDIEVHFRAALRVT